MRKVQSATSDGKHCAWIFYCPGCEECHQFDARWTFNGDVHRPSFQPSLVVDANGDSRCHLIITDGRITFLPDCRHGLAGQTVEIPNWGTV